MNLIIDTVILPFALAEPFLFLYHAWLWLTNPTVVGWMGIVAAIVAAFAVSPRQWICSPIAIPGRCICVVIVWVAVVLVLSAVTPGGSGLGPRAGEPKPPNESVAEGSGTVTVIQLPKSADARIGDDITIKFIPASDNLKLAERFACVLLIQLPDKPGNSFEIRSPSMSNLIEQFKSQLTKSELQSVTANVSVRIVTNPYPGEPIIQKLKQLCHDENPKCNFVIGE